MHINDCKLKSLLFFVGKLYFQPYEAVCLNFLLGTVRESCTSETNVEPFKRHESGCKPPTRALDITVISKQLYAVTKFSKLHT